MTGHSRRQRVRALWPTSIPPSSTTNDIPVPVDPTHQPPRLPRHASDPVYPTLIPPPSGPLPLRNITAHDTMAGHATITFSQTGVQPPVYVTTSINDWTPVEMDVNEDKTASDNLIFRKEFNDVAEGSYQYKIRVGEDHWVLDESKETGMLAHVGMKRLF
jgi:hypothetical protein